TTDMAAEAQKVDTAVSRAASTAGSSPALRWQVASSGGLGVALRRRVRSVWHPGRFQNHFFLTYRISHPADKQIQRVTGGIEKGLLTPAASVSSFDQRVSTTGPLVTASRGRWPPFHPVSLWRARPQPWRLTNTATPS